jgi:DNA primase
MEFLSGIVWTERAEDYFLGRGAKPDAAQAMHLGEWVGTDIQDSDFVRKYGKGGERLLGWACWPVRTAANRLIGMDFRNIEFKQNLRYLFPKDEMHASWVCHPDSFQKIWDGGAVWLVEGMFDLLALEWAVPSTDAVLSCDRASLGHKQAESLRRLDPSYVHIVFDRDSAGERGADFAMKSLKKLGLRHGLYAYGGGKDPGVLWDKGGAAAVRSAFGV